MTTRYRPRLLGDRAMMVLEGAGLLAIVVAFYCFAEPLGRLVCALFGEAP
jgi:hypothetical protein